MKLTLSPKDTLCKLTLKGVSTFMQEGNTLCVVFKNGRTRNYPMSMLWYWESHVKNHVTKPVRK